MDFINTINKDIYEDISDDDKKILEENMDKIMENLEIIIPLIKSKNDLLKKLTHNVYTDDKVINDTFYVDNTMLVHMNEWFLNEMYLLYSTIDDEKGKFGMDTDIKQNTISPKTITPKLLTHIIIYLESIIEIYEKHDATKMSKFFTIMKHICSTMIQYLDNTTVGSDMYDKTIGRDKECIKNLTDFFSYLAITDNTNPSIIKNRIEYYTKYKHCCTNIDNENTMKNGLCNKLKENIFIQKMDTNESINANNYNKSINVNNKNSTQNSTQNDSNEKTIRLGGNNTLNILRKSKSKQKRNKRETFHRKNKKLNKKTRHAKKKYNKK